MKITELIEKLEGAKKEFGDLEVCYSNDSMEFFEYDGFTIAINSIDGQETFTKIININPEEF
jgi:hypothetical protein